MSIQSFLQVLKMPFFKCLIPLIIITYSDSPAQVTLPAESLTISDFKDKPKTKWVFETKSPIFSSPVVSEGLVYFGGLDSIFYAIGISSGHEKWRFRTKGWGLSNNIHDSILYIGSADERVLIAAHPETGKEFWKKIWNF
jgi:outer membrane protein assembly factor BamB